jgi:hypothetical protein
MARAPKYVFLNLPDIEDLLDKAEERTVQRFDLPCA